MWMQLISEFLCISQSSVSMLKVRASIKKNKKNKKIVIIIALTLARNFAFPVPVSSMW